MIRRWCPYVVAGVLVCVWAASRWCDFGVAYRAAAGGSSQTYDGRHLGLGFLNGHAVGYSTTASDYDPYGFWDSTWYLGPFGFFFDTDQTKFPERFVPFWQAVSFAPGFRVDTVGVTSHYLLVCGFALIAITLWRRRSRPGPGCCPTCGYDLRGNPDMACPECGRAQSEVTT